MIRFVTLIITLFYFSIFSEIKFSITTDSYNGIYSPRHVCAIWLTDGDDNYLYPIEINGESRRSHLRKWYSHSKSYEVDGYTSATLRNHQKHDYESPGTFADGTYKIWVEISENNTSTNELTWGGHAAFEFQVSGSDIISLEPANVTFKQSEIFKEVSIYYKNDASSTFEINKTDNISYNLKQTSNKIQISNVNIKELSIFSLQGKKLLNSKSSSIDISSLSKGSYFIKFKTLKRSIIKGFRIK